MTNYLLWLNRLDQWPDGRCSAVVELMATNLNKVVSGDQEFVQGMADALHLPLRTNAWSVSGFRSTYYSEYPESDDWRDRFPRLWRITLTGQGTGIAASTVPSVAPAAYDGYDSTWNPLDEPPETTICSYLAIGAYLRGAVSQGLLERLRSLWPASSVETIICGAGALTDTRIVVDLGTVDLDGQSDEVDAVQTQLGELGLLTRWANVRPRIAHLGH